MKKVIILAELKEETFDKFASFDNNNHLDSESYIDLFRDLDPRESIYIRVIEDTHLESYIDELVDDGYDKDTDENGNPFCIKEGNYDDTVECVIVM